jgi:hypothetical protein
MPSEEQRQYGLLSSCNWMGRHCSRMWPQECFDPLEKTCGAVEQTNAGNQEWFTSGRATPARTTTRIPPRGQRRPLAARHRRQEAVGQAPSLGTVGDLSRPSEDSRKCSAMTRNTSSLDSRGRQFRCRRALPGRRGHWSSVPRACLPTRGSRRELQARSSRVPKRRLRQGLRRFFDSSACPAFAASSLCLRIRGPTGTAMRLHRAPRRGRQL